MLGDRCEQSWTRTFRFFPFFFHSFSGRSNCLYISLSFFHSLLFFHSQLTMIFLATPDPGLAIQPRLFLLIRTIAFSFIMFLCFLWSILLSIALYSQWDVMDSEERAIILTIVAVDFTTVVMLPVLLLWQFRPWLDAARFALLIILHTGAAGLFTYKSRRYKFHCSSAITTDKGDPCDLISSYVIISSWLVAALIICYACGLGILFRRLSRIPPTPVADTESLTKVYLTV